MSNFELGQVDNIDVDLSEVKAVVFPVGVEQVTVTPTFEKQVVYPSPSKYINKVTVEKIPDGLADVSDTTATARDVSLGKVFYDSEGVKTEGTYDKNKKKEFWVKVVDYDGTVIAREEMDAGETFTLPAPPIHERLNFQEWVATVEIVNNTVTVVDDNIMVGPTYETKSGMNEFDVELTKVTGLTVTFASASTGTDWGDGVIDDLSSHTYADYGGYTICTKRGLLTNLDKFLTPKDAIVELRLKDGETGIGSGQDSPIEEASALRAISVPRTLGSRAGGYCYAKTCMSLRAFVFPNGNMFNFSQSAFYRCFQLDTIVLGYGSKNMFYASYIFENTALKEVVLPKSTNKLTYGLFQYSLIESVNIPDNCDISEPLIFYNCKNLHKAIIGNVTKVGQNCFCECNNLSEVRFTAGVDTIASQAFHRCYPLSLCDFSHCSKVPALESTSAFDMWLGRVSSFKIVVPDALYDEWVVATNWSTLANYIYKASEVEL